MAASWQRLGDAVACKGIGVNRVRIDPGRLSTPPHSHGASEEVVFVLGGSGLSWQDEQVYEIRPGDCVVHLADHEEHTLCGGPDGLEVLIYGTRHPTELGWLPRSSADPVRLALGRGPHGRSLGRRGAVRAAGARRAGAAAEEHRQRRGRRGGGMGKGRLCCVERPLGRIAGAAQTGMRHEVVPDGEAQLPAALPRLRGGVLRRARRRGHLPARRR